MWWTRLLLSLVLTALLLCAAQVRADGWLIEVKGAIGPATADHMVRGLDAAQEAGAQLVVLRIDTPGGLDSAMRDMVRAILASTIPVVAYVAPGGARAASAGTYLLYASHIAAMAPGTNLGAATPVQISSPGLPGTGGKDRAGGSGQGGESSEGSGSGQGDPEAKPADSGGGSAPGSAMERKMVNDAVAYIQSLAQLRGRNAEWAARAVREGVSLSADDALEKGVIELIAADSAGLLAQLDGREVQVGARHVTLATGGLALQVHEMDWRSEFLGVITNPNVAYILMLIGIYGLLLEFYNPGVGIPGVAGAICLVLALYAFQALPVSYAGMGLILLGIALMTAEAFAPSFGVLGLGGIGAFVMGSIMLMDTQVPAFQIALPTIVAVAAFSAALLMFALGMLARARRQKVVSGAERIAGAIAVIESVRADGTALARLEGELWQVRCAAPLAAQDRVRVTAMDGLTLEVEKCS